MQLAETVELKQHRKPGTCLDHVTGYKPAHHSSSYVYKR